MNQIIERAKSKKEIEIIAEIIKNIIEPNIGKEKTEKMLEKLEIKEESRMSPFTKCLLDLEIQYKTEGKKEGEKEGKKEGKREAIKKAVKNMIKFGEPEDKIMKYIGISKEELENIKSIL